MMLEERAALLELRRTGAGDYAWTPLREVAVQLPGERRGPESREEARAAPRRFWLRERSLGPDMALRWQGRHYALCGVRRTAPLRSEVLAAPVRVSECVVWRLAAGVDADKRPRKSLEQAGRFPGVLSGLEAEPSEGEEPAAVLRLQQRAVLETPAAVHVEPGDLIEVDGGRWMVRGVEPGDWGNRCLLSRKVDV